MEFTKSLQLESPDEGIQAYSKKWWCGKTLVNLANKYCLLIFYLAKFQIHLCKYIAKCSQFKLANFSLPKLYETINSSRFYPAGVLCYMVILKILATYHSKIKLPKTYGANLHKSYAHSHTNIKLSQFHIYVCNLLHVVSQLFSWFHMYVAIVSAFLLVMN